MALFSTFWNVLVCFIPQPICGFVKWAIDAVNRILQKLRRSAFIQAVQALTGFIDEKGRCGAVVFLLNSAGLSKAIKFHIMVHSKDMNFHKDILKSLGISLQDQVLSVDQSDVIIAFVPIVSRAGTDIEMALLKIPENRPAVFVVLHHTFNENLIAPENCHAVSRSNVLAVDFLFHEDLGMLNCPQNTKALEATERFLRDIKCNQKEFRWL